MTPPAPNPVVAGPTPAQVEQQAWEAASRANTVAAYDAYLAEYPAGRYASAARVARAGLQPVPVKTEPPVPVVSAGPKAGEVVKECGVCPQMVVIPAGSFVMGSPETEKGRHSDEGPQRRVEVRGFLLGKREVTQGEWKAVMGSNPSYFKACGNDCPVEQVSWEDAQAYIRKLNELSGKSYRLPSEAEWEYAARGGTTTPFHTGETITTAQANFDGRETYNGSAKGVYRQKTVANCGFPVNGFGLCDMHGNVAEWVEDVWHEDYRGAPTDGSAWTSGGDQARRVLRGSSCFDFPQYLRSASRNRNTPDHRIHGIGFRIARTF